MSEPYPGVPPSSRIQSQSEEPDDSLQAFADEVKALTAKHHVVAPPNTVIVQPGNKSFTSITAALDSITDARETNRYMLYAGPGTYRERVHMKPWVILSGTLDQKNDPVSTIVASPVPYDWGTVRAASNSSVQSFTISSKADRSADGIMPVAVSAIGATSFTMTNCDLIADDGGFRTESVVALNLEGGSSVRTDYTDLYATSTWKGTTYPAAVVLWEKSKLSISQAELIASAHEQSAGGASYGGSNLELLFCKVTGQTFSLTIYFNDAFITARKCTLNGPVGKGVKVIN
jgi:hypothetical protein